MALHFLRLEVFAFLGGLAFLLIMRLLSGEINVSGLLWQTNPMTGKAEFSPARIQLLVMTLVAAGNYLLQVIAHPHVLPEISNQLVLLQGASGGTYLLAKYRAIFQNYFN